MNRLRDADRVLGHSLSDEAYRKPSYDWYRPTVWNQIEQAVGCLAMMAGILIAALVLWGLLVGLFLVAS